MIIDDFDFCWTIPVTDRSLSDWCTDPVLYNEAYQTYCLIICLDMGDESYQKCDRAYEDFYWCNDGL